MKLRILSLVVLMALANPALPSVARPSTDVHLYILRGSAEGARQCSPVTPEISQALTRIIKSNLPAIGNTDPNVILDYVTNQSTSTSTKRIGRRAPADPIGDLAQKITNPNQKPIYAVVANVCPSEDIATATVDGFVISWDEDAKGGLPSSGSSVKGTMDVLEAADFSKIFDIDSYDGNGFLPVSGDNADIINTQLQRNLRGLTPITDVKPLAKLCAGTQNRLLVAGQNSLATQQLDTFRTTIGAASLASFTEPQPWSSVYKVGAALVTLVYIPNSQEIPVQVFDCKDPKHIMAFGSEIAFASPSDPQRLIVGHASRSVFGTNNRMQRIVLDNAIADLQNQLDCIISQRLSQRDHVPIVHDDRIANSNWCRDYYHNLPFEEVNLNTPITPTRPGSRGANP